MYRRTGVTMHQLYVEAEVASGEIEEPLRTVIEVHLATVKWQEIIAETVQTATTKGVRQ